MAAAERSALPACPGRPPPAGVFEHSVHFIDARTGELVDKVEAAHEAQVGAAWEDSV